MSLRSLLRAALVLFFVFPFLFLLVEFRLGSVPEWGELQWAFKNTFYQAFLSTIFSLGLGLWVALGLVSLPPTPGRRGGRFFVDLLCLLPNFLPPLFILLATLSVIEPFPMGTVGIALVHTFMNFGLVAVLLAEVIENKLGPVTELSYVEGVSRWHFLTRAFFPMLRKDMMLIGLFVFVVCFGSFSVPLVVGGGKGTTVEVLIYEKIRLTHEWGDAVVLALLQSGFIFLISLLAYYGRATRRQERWASLKLLGASSGLLVLVLISGVYIWGYIQSFVKGLPLLSTFAGMSEVLTWSFLGSLAIGLSVGGLCFVLLMVIAACWSQSWFTRFLNGYVAPSTALACFSLLVWGSNEGLMPFVKIPVALTLLSVSSLYRMGWGGELLALQSQVTVAHTMGASAWQIYRQILWPQLLARAGLLAGIAAVWACGDFAVSRILAHRDISIAMMTETLMTSYRLSQATVLSGLILFAGLLCFVFFVGGSHVLRRKLIA